jgi:thioredoxin-like negative regulator of GroEL
MITRLLILGGVGAVTFVLIVALRRYFGNAQIPRRIDLSDIRADRAPAALVEFTSPYCYECQEALPLLKAASRIYEAPLAVIDAKQKPELASKYSIRHTPTILVVDSKGAVRGGWLGVPPEKELEAAIVSAHASFAAA